MTSSIPASTLLEQISGELLVCRVCHQSLKRPKSLACRHTFCEDCLYDLLSTSVDRHHLVCPACHTLSVLPPGGVRRLPEDPVVARLSDVIERRRQSTADDDSDVESNRDGSAGRKSCEICSPAHGSSSSNGVIDVRRKVAQSRCLECCKLLCSTCARLHRRTNVTSTHSLFSLDAATSSRCRYHDNETVRFYCDQCDTSICVLCAYGDHAGHVMTSFAEAVKRRRESIQTTAEECRTELDSCRRRLEILERRESEIRQAENAINEAALNIVTYVRRRERQLLAALRAATCRRRQPAAAAAAVSSHVESDRTLAPKPMLVDAIRQLSDVCQAADNLLVDVDRGGTAAAFLIARRELLEKMTSLLDRQRRAAADNNVEELDLYEDLPTPQDGAPYIEFVPCGLRSPNAMLLGKLTVDNDKAGNDLADDDSTRQQKRPRRFSKDDDDKSVFAPFYESGSETGHDDFEELIVFRRRSRTESEKRMDCGVNGVTLAQTECRSTPCTSTTNDDSSCDGDLCLNGFDVKPSISTSDCSDVNDNQNVDRTSRHSVETQTEVAPSPPTPSSHRCCDAAVVSATCGQATSRDGSTSNVECGGVYVSVAADVGTGHTDISASSTRSVTRRVQTDRVVIRDSWTETYSTPTADKSTTCYFSSWNPVTVDRSTMTSIMYRDPRNTRSTSTDWLVITRDQETSTLPPTTLNCGVQVDRPRTRCRMVDVRPETSNKSTCTSQLVVCIDTKSDFGELTKVISAMKSAVRTADAAVGNDIEMTVDSQIAVASNEINQDDISKRDSDSFSESVDGSAKTDRLMPAQTAAEHASTEDYIPEIISFRTQDNDIQSACVDDRLSDSSSECLQDVDVTKLQSDGTSRDDGILTDVSSAQTDIRDDSELSFDSNSVVTTNDSDDTLDFNAVGSSDVIPSTLFLDEKADMVPGLLSRLVALLPEIVRTVDELTSSHSNSGSTAHLLLEVADIAKNLQSSSPQQRHTAGGIDETVSFSAPAPDTEGAQAMIGSGMSASATTVDCAVGNSCVSVCDAAVGSDQPSSAECPSRPDWNQQPTVVDCGVGCSVVTTCDQSTMALTTRPMMFDKETATVHGHMLHKNVGTDSQSKADKQTSTSVCDVASAYLGTVSALTMTRRTITVSRGTCTPPLQQQQQPPLLNRSQSEIVRVDRASSPIPVSRCDKSVSASRAEALEPLDTFQTPSSPLSPRSRRPLALSPRSSKLACINEAASDDDELGTSSAGGRVNSQSGGNASATVLPPMSAISSRLVAARSLNRGVGVSTSTATGGGVRCGVNSLQRPTLGRHRPNLPGSPLRIPLIAAIPPLNRSVFDFENVIANAAANRAAASASSSTPATSTGMSSSSASADGDETAMGRRPLQTKSTSLPDFSIVPTLAQHPEPDNNLPQQQLTTTAESMTKADAVS